VRRSLALLGLVVLVAAASAHAAGLDPAKLVLGRGDLPGPGWIPSGRNGYRSASQAAQGAPPGTAARLVRYGFRRGYDASYGTTSALVGSTAYVFATTAGAKRAFGIYREAPPAGTKKIPFGRVGDASLGFRSKARPRLTAVVWLKGPVLSIVLTGGLTDRDTLALAKTQNSRVVAAVGG
jgi:hypothetical protein